MEPQQPTTHRTDEDVEGHVVKRRADAERDEADDVEGHRRYIVRADAERDETDDTEGSCMRGRADAERDEADDTEGHGTRIPADAERDDVEGHAKRHP